MSVVRYCISADDPDWRLVIAAIDRFTDDTGALSHPPMEINGELVQLETITASVNGRSEATFVKMDR